MAINLKLPFAEVGDWTKCYILKVVSDVWLQMHVIIWKITFVLPLGMNLSKFLLP